VTELAPLRALAERLARTAGEHLDVSRQRTDLQVSSKGTATDMVTDVDRSTERLIVDALTEARPHDGILGEEGTAVSGTSGVDWVIDPLDGTTNFLYDHPGFSVSIAAVVDGEPAVGVVLDVLAGHLFSAERGGGSSRDGHPLRCPDPPPLDRALVATGFAYDAATRRRQAEVLSEVIPEIRDIRRMGGAAVDLCSVAMGRVDAYYERGLQPWDLAAGAVIATEAGARVGDLRGGQPSADYCIAAHPMLFDAITSLLREVERDRGEESFRRSPRSGSE
jgi:myo-inositol-1(or 4)-monophosphatase